MKRPSPLLLPLVAAAALSAAAEPALCTYRWGTGGCEKGLY